jgi:hypothetical protein
VLLLLSPPHLPRYKGSIEAVEAVEARVLFANV